MSINVTQLNVGWFTAAAGIWRRGEPMDRTTRFPIPAYLIETEDERILVDTGLHAGAASDSASHYDGAPSIGAFELERSQSVADQVDLDTITRVVLTQTASAERLRTLRDDGATVIPGHDPEVLRPGSMAI